jgi:TolB-like protein/Flp pilus assembly protein TadD
MTNMSEHLESPKQKPPPVDRLSQFWRRINDHKMVQWTVAYVAVAYAIQHGVTLTREALEWPQIVERGSLLLLALGLPVVMTFAWYHGERASRHFSTAEMTIVSILLMIGSILFYAFVQPQQAAVAAASPQQQASVQGQPGTVSIAVLPLANLSGDPAQEFFSDGMTDEITSALAKVHDLRVVGRTSAFQFKGEKKDLRAIGQALSARYLIDGSVRRFGDSVRITAQLVEASNGVQLWSENYNRELKDVFAVQEDIAQAIAAALKVPLGLQQGENLVSNRTNDLESYQQYLHARALARARALPDAIDVLERVVATDPKFAPASALLAQAYGLSPIYTPLARIGPISEARPAILSYLDKGEAAAQSAIAADPKNAGGYAALGMLNAQRGNWAEADNLLHQALALDPNDPDVLHLYSTMLTNVGHVKQAAQMREQLAELEPFVPIYNIFTASTLLLSRQDAAAIATLEKIQLGPSEGVNYLRNVLLGWAYAVAGRYDEAADTLLAIQGNQVSRHSVEDAARLLRSRSRKQAAPQLPSIEGEMGFVYAYVGAPERMVEASERALALGTLYTNTNGMFWLPQYTELRKSERFKTFVRKAGMLDYWRAKDWPDLCHPIGADDFACE